MNGRTSIQLLVAFALATAATPTAAQQPQSEWLWGVEGLVRTPVDIAADFGGMFIGYEANARVTFDDGTPAPRTLSAASDTLSFRPEGIEGGLRFAGGIGYWNCCVLIEPAIGIRWNRALGSDKSDDSPRVFDPTDPGLDENVFIDAEYMNGWDLMIGTQITWMVPEDHFLGGLFGGQPLVFFPYMGVAHAEWDAEIAFRDPTNAPPRNLTLSRDYEDDNFLVGFDLDLPLPGSVRSLTHALTFSFRWNEDTADDHDFGPFLNSGARAIATCGAAPVGGGDRSCFNIDGSEGWKVGLYYHVTWNDFEGFFKRVVFGPVN